MKEKTMHGAERKPRRRLNKVGGVGESSGSMISAVAPLESTQLPPLHIGLDACDGARPDVISLRLLWNAVSTLRKTCELAHAPGADSMPKQLSATCCSRHHQAPNDLPRRVRQYLWWFVHFRRRLSHSTVSRTPAQENFASVVEQSSPRRRRLCRLSLGAT